MTRKITISLEDSVYEYLVAKTNNRGFYAGRAQGRDLPECYGAWQTISGRFYRWRKKGIWRPHQKEATTASRSLRENELVNQFRRWQRGACSSTRCGSNSGRGRPKQ